MKESDNHSYHLWLLYLVLQLLFTLVCAAKCWMAPSSTNQMLYLVTVLTLLSLLVRVIRERNNRKKGDAASE